MARNKLDTLERRLDNLAKTAMQQAAEAARPFGAIVFELLRGDFMRSRIMRYWPEWNGKIPEFLTPTEIETLTGISEGQAETTEKEFLKQKYGIDIAKAKPLTMEEIEEIRREAQQYALEMSRYPNSKTIEEPLAFANNLIHIAAHKHAAAHKH